MQLDIFGIIPLYTEDLLPALSVILLAILLERGISLRRGYLRTKGHLIGLGLFGLYLLLIVQMTVPFSQLWQSLRIWGFAVQGGVELEPFREIYNFWHYGSRQEILINLVGNVLVFLPMGLLPPLIWKCFRRIRWGWIWWFGPPVVIETLQLCTPRATTVDDVILNTLGALMGYLLSRLLCRTNVGAWFLLKKSDA